MTTIRTVGGLIDSVRRRLGWPAADTFVSTTAMREMLQQSQLELHAFLTQIYQGDLRVVTVTQAVSAGSSTAAISVSAATGSGVYRVLRVSTSFNGFSVPMRRLQWQAEAMQETSQAWDASTDLRYRFVRYLPDATDTSGGTFYFHPTPSTAQVVKIIFALGLPSFSVTSQQNLLGHDEYLILDTMIKCLQAEEADTTVVERQKARYMELVEQNETPIDIGQPETIFDARSNARDWWP